MIKRGASPWAIVANSELTPKNRIRAYIEYKTGQSISADQFNVMLRDYNRFEMPLKQRMEQILKNPDPFVEFYKNRSAQLN